MTNKSKTTTKNKWILERDKVFNTKNISFTIKRGTTFDVYEAPESNEEEQVYIITCSDTITHNLLKELSLYVGDLVTFEDLVYITERRIASM